MRVYAGKFADIHSIFYKWQVQACCVKIRQSKRPGPPTTAWRAPPSGAEGGQSFLIAGFSRTVQHQESLPENFRETKSARRSPGAIFRAVRVFWTLRECSLSRLIAQMAPVGKPQAIRAMSRMSLRVRDG